MEQNEYPKEQVRYHPYTKYMIYTLILFIFLFTYHGNRLMKLDATIDKDVYRLKSYFIENIKPQQ